MSLETTDPSAILISAADARNRKLGGIHKITLHRWLRSEALGFPDPVTINGRHFFVESEIDAWIASRREAVA